jgi:two-component sensor histidine kinase
VIYFASFLEDVDARDRETVMAKIQDFMARGGEYRVEYRLAGADAGERWVEGLGRGQGPLGPRPAGPIAGGRQLVLVWREQGGPRVEPPEQTSFGFQLIKAGIAHELDGEIVLSFDPEGVRCELRFPNAAG